MGDRRNVIVKSEKDQVTFYTHWSGTELPKIVQRALKRKERWDDYPYLARIIFCEMVAGDVKGETGYGISGKDMCETSGRDMIVDVDKQTVQLGRRTSPIAFMQFIGMPMSEDEEEEG